jgi:hypothetical protein
MSFLEIVILIFLLFLFLRVLASYLAPFLVKLFVRRMQKRFYEQNPNYKKKAESKEGKVTIHRVNDTKDNEIPPDLGDYIDYEEINNNQNPSDE